MAHHDWLGLKKELPHRRRLLLTMLSFLIPLVMWCARQLHPVALASADRMSRTRAMWITSSTDMDVPRADFRPGSGEGARGRQDAARRATASIPVYLPAPHEVARAFYTAFKTPPRLQNEPWLHESLGHSIRTIFLGFLSFIDLRRAAGNSLRHLPLLCQIAGTVHRILSLPARAGLRRAVRGDPRHR